MRRAYFLTFIDQGVISGANFALQIILIRLASPEDYGIFAFWQVVSLMLLDLQNALVSTHLSVRGPRAQPGAERAAVETLLASINMVLSMAVLIPTAVLGVTVAVCEGRPIMLPLIVALYLTSTVFYQYARAFAFSRLSPGIVLKIDLVFVAAVAIAMAGGVLLTKVPLLATIFGSLTAGATAAGLVGLGSQAGSMRLSISPNVLRSYHEIWNDSKWSLLSVFYWQVQTRAYVYIISATSGAAAIAELYASQLLSRPISMLYDSWSMLARPQFAAARASETPQAFSSRIRSGCLGLGAVIVAYSIVLALAWPVVRRHLYGNQYPDVAFMAIGWGLVTSAFVARGVFICALQAMRAFRLLSMANAIGAISSLGGVLLAATVGGYPFVPMGALFGEIVTTVFVLHRFRSAVDQAPASPRRPIEAPSATS